MNQVGLKDRVRAVVVDPDPVWQQAVTAELTRSNVAVVANSGELQRAPELADTHKADLLLIGLDDEVDKLDLYRLLRRVHKLCPDLITVVFVDSEDRLTVDAALAGGAYWAVDRRLGATNLVRAVTEAYAAQQKIDRSTDRVGTPARLTRRELEILRLVAQDRPNEEVAKILWVTNQTIKFHLLNTYKKLNVRNRAEATRWAIAHGLVPPPAPDDDPEDGPGAGDREPRRPIRPSQAGSVAVDPAEESDLPDEIGRSRDARAA